MGVGAAAGVAIGSQLYNRVGPRSLVVGGIAVFVIGSIGFTTLGVSTNPWSLWPWLFLRGFGFGSTGVPLQNLALARVTNLAMARASSLVNATRQIAGAIGVAALTSYLTMRATFHGTQRSRHPRPLLGGPPRPSGPSHLRDEVRRGAGAQRHLHQGPASLVTLHSSPAEIAARTAATTPQVLCRAPPVLTISAAVDRRLCQRSPLSVGPA